MLGHVWMAMTVIATGWHVWYATPSYTLPRCRARHATVPLVMQHGMELFVVPRDCNAVSPNGRHSFT